jgi:hypothetical protein
MKFEWRTFFEERSVMGPDLVGLTSTPWSILLLEKLVVAQLIEKLSFMGPEGSLRSDLRV